MARTQLFRALNLTLSLHRPHFQRLECRSLPVTTFEPDFDRAVDRRDILELLGQGSKHPARLVGDIHLAEDLIVVDLNINGVTDATSL